jgi:hypothetical protein
MLTFAALFIGLQDFHAARRVVERRAIDRGHHVAGQQAKLVEHGPVTAGYTR